MRPENNVFCFCVALLAVVQVSAIKNCKRHSKTNDFILRNCVLANLEYYENATTLDLNNVAFLNPENVANLRNVQALHIANSETGGTMLLPDQLQMIRLENMKDFDVKFRAGGQLVKLQLKNSNLRRISKCASLKTLELSANNDLLKDLQSLEKNFPNLETVELLDLGACVPKIYESAKIKIQRKHSSGKVEFCNNITTTTTTTTAPTTTESTTKKGVDSPTETDARAKIYAVIICLVVAIVVIIIALTRIKPFWAVRSRHIAMKKTTDIF